MPIHFQPTLRALEEAEESNGLIQSRDSAGVTDLKATESAHTTTKVVPVAWTYIFRGTPYTAS